MRIFCRFFQKQQFLEDKVLKNNSFNNLQFGDNVV